MCYDGSVIGMEGYQGIDLNTVGKFESLLQEEKQVR